jgi:cytochrome c biogenesis protein ResB
MPLNPAADILINDRFPEYRGLDAWTRLGWVAMSRHANYKGYVVTLERAVDYTMLEVSRNPGLPVVYVGFGLILFGVFVSFYVTHKVVRVSISPQGKGSRVVAGATSRAGPSVFDSDFDHLRRALS